MTKENVEFVRKALDVSMPSCTTGRPAGAGLSRRVSDRTRTGDHLDHNSGVPVVLG